MKKTTMVAAVVLCLLTLGHTASAQKSSGSNYRTALGAKVYFANGTLGGINIKHFVNANGAIEGSLLFDRGLVGFEGLYDWHGDINGANGLKWYVGGGGMLLFPSGDYYRDRDVWFALRGTLGLDFKFPTAPINIAFDVNPTFNLTPFTDFDLWAGLAFRFTF